MRGTGHGSPVHEKFLNIDTLTQHVQQLKLSVDRPPWLCWEDNECDLDYTADCCVFFSNLDTTGETVMTQSPASLSLSPGEKITLTCRASVNNYLAWYQQEPGWTPSSSYMMHLPTRATGVQIPNLGLGQT